MKDLLETVRSRAQQLTDSLLFNRRQPVETVPIVYHLNVLPARDDISDLAPFGHAFPHRFASGSDKRRLRVVLRICIYQEDRDRALTELAALEAALFPLSWPSWPPWVLESFSGVFGDDETGQQPHPLYLYTLQLDFVSQQTMRVRQPDALQ
jgi:hypothetical protein